MIVVLPGRNRFVPGLSIGEFSLCSQTQAGEELHGSIDRGVPHLRIQFDDLGVNLGQIPVARGTDEDIEDFLALFGGLQPSLGDEGLKRVGSNEKCSFLKLKFNFNLTDLSLFVNAA